MADGLKEGALLESLEEDPAIICAQEGSELPDSLNR
jgi:hypothetical protein